MIARIALFYAPAPRDPLWQAGTAWLGRDPQAASAVPQPDVPGLPEITAEPRLYGFHATLKPPMRLQPGCTWHDLLNAVTRLAATIPPFDLPPLAPTRIGGFLALTEATPSPALRALADAAIAGVDAFRAPPSAEELTRRRRAGLSAAEEAMLAKWGYPYAFDTWQFHMTLSRRLTDEEAARIRPAAEAHFAVALRARRRVRDICLFTQSAPGTDFVLAERVVLRG
ncbi:MAG TPA: DUF1045 domain-containing protein [Acetobacteraceae bacterium]|nr:DUF1045 domain-containing protein [Acetobacteraceae bacterium]